jgi:hypothetical protein
MDEKCHLTLGKNKNKTQYIYIYIYIGLSTSLLTKKFNQLNKLRMVAKK